MKPVPEPIPRPLPEIRYRIVCYELEGEQQTVIFDATARGFIAVTGTIADDGTMHGEGTHAGPLTLGRRLARLIANDEHSPAGWRIDGQKAWLWEFAGENVTVYLIAGGRGCEHAGWILGEEFAGRSTSLAAHPQDSPSRQSSTAPSGDRPTVRPLRPSTTGAADERT